jgi:hypothetical protein
MKHLTIADKSVLLGDEAADLLALYAAALVDAHRADTVELRAIHDAEGGAPEETVLTAVLDSGTPLVIETVRSDLDEPDNAQLVQYVFERLGRIQRQRYPEAEAVSGAEIWNDPDVQ